MELLVGIGISTAILGVVIYNQSKYTDTAGLSIAARTVATDLTTAQTYGVSVKQLTANNFNTAYGIHFRTAAGGGTSGLNTDYVFFADSNKNSQYGNTGVWTGAGAGATCPTPPGECQQRTRLSSGIVFVGPFCYIPTSGATCTSQTVAGSNLTNIHRIDVTFSRPQSKAIFKLYGSGGNILNATAIGVGIRLQNSATPRATKWIYIYETGQISVQ